MKTVKIYEQYLLGCLNFFIVHTVFNTFKYNYVNRCISHHNNSVTLKLNSFILILDIFVLKKPTSTSSCTLPWNLSSEIKQSDHNLGCTHTYLQCIYYCLADLCMINIKQILKRAQHYKISSLWFYDAHICESCCIAKVNVFEILLF